MTSRRGHDNLLMIGLERSFSRQLTSEEAISTQFNTCTRSRGIEWTDETRNATGGCLHDCQWFMPDGTIAVCYAKELAERGVAKKA